MEWAAFEVAERLGHGWVGPEHALLAILLGPEDDPAARALREAGLEAAAVERRLQEMDSAPPGTRGPMGGRSPNPAFYQMWGRAEGLAAGFGDRQVQATHVLLAMLWDRRRWRFHEGRGVTREKVLSELRCLGLKVPYGSPPPLDRELKFTQEVEAPAEKLDAVLQLLFERHRLTVEGPSWGFNFRAETVAVINAEDGIDLKAIVDEVLAADPRG
jgi:hypothetical protein